jgi:hypothetical protein
MASLPRCDGEPGRMAVGFVITESRVHHGSLFLLLNKPGSVSAEPSNRVLLRTAVTIRVDLVL